MIADWPIISLTVWLPIIGGLMVLASGDREVKATKWTALIVAVLTSVVSLPLWFASDSSTVRCSTLSSSSS